MTVWPFPIAAVKKKRYMRTWMRLSSVIRITGHWSWPQNNTFGMYLSYICHTFDMHCCPIENVYLTVWAPKLQVFPSTSSLKLPASAKQVVIGSQCTARQHTSKCNITIWLLGRVYLCIHPFAPEGGKLACTWQRMRPYHYLHTEFSVRNNSSKVGFYLYQKKPKNYCNPFSPMFGWFIV